MALHNTHLRKSTNSAILSSATPLAAKEGRANYFIQNCGQNALFVKEGASCSTTDFTFILAAGTANDNGTGGSKSSDTDGCWTGAISIAGTSPRYVITERQENI